jgi:thioredoxin reductase (NADPH)
MENSEKATEKLIILGAGPAGLTAAIYAARADLQPLVLSGMQLGGQVSITDMVENYPGFPDGIGGLDLTDVFQKQAEKFGTRILLDNATRVDLSQRPFRVESASGQSFAAESLIVATGASPNKLGVPGEDEYTGRGVSYCATCDGYFFRGKNVVVVGGGDSALQEGIFLSHLVNSVTIIHRRDALRAGPLLQKRAMANPKITFVWDAVVEEVLGNEKVNGVRLRNVKTDERSTLPTDGVFIFIGYSPNSELFQGQIEMDKLGYIRADQRQHTSVEGVFAAGEIADPVFRQVVSSAGMGAAAAIEATHYVEELEDTAASVEGKQVKAVA